MIIIMNAFFCLSLNTDHLHEYSELEKYTTKNKNNNKVNEKTFRIV